MVFIALVFLAIRFFISFPFLTQLEKQKYFLRIDHCPVTSQARRPMGARGQGPFNVGDIRARLANTWARI